MTDWINPVAKWVSFLYRMNTIDTRVQVIESWMKKSTGWISGLQTVLPPRPPKHTYHKYMLAKTEILELWLIAWGEGAQTSIHNHSEKESWLRVIQGELYEEEPGGFVMNRIPAGGTGYQEGDAGVHRIFTVGPAYSIHISAPITLS